MSTRIPKPVGTVMLNGKLGRLCVGVVEDKVRRRRLSKGLSKLNSELSPRPCLKRPGVVLDEPGSACLVTGCGLRLLGLPTLSFFFKLHIEIAPTDVRMSLVKVILVSQSSTSGRAKRRNILGLVR